MGQAWKYKLLQAGEFRLDGGSMFGVVPRVLWEKMTKSDEKNRILLQTNCLYMEIEGKKVLVETGYGGKWREKERDIFALEDRTILDALAEVEVAPDSIETIIVTHLHFDHAGGLTHFDKSGEAVSSFPHAKIFVQRVEWEDALANKSTMTKTYLRNHLDPVAGQVELVEGAAEILPGLSVFPVPGHTWGQQAVRFEDGEGVVCFPGDVCPTINHGGAAFSMGYDMLPHENMKTKASLFEKASAEGWRLVLDHEPDPRKAVVRVVRDERGRFHLEPVS